MVLESKLHISFILPVGEGECDCLHSSVLDEHQTAGHAETYRLACMLLEPFLHNCFVMGLCKSLRSFLLIKTGVENEGHFYW